MELKLEEVANGLAAWAANKKEIEWVRLIGSRVTSKRHTDGSPPLSSSDLDIAIKINAKHLKKHRDGKKHVWSDETDSLSIFGFDHEISWLNELKKISPWAIDLNFCGSDTSNLSDYLEKDSLLIYESSQD